MANRGGAVTATAPVETNIGVFYEAIELTAIAPSKTNPRKHFDEAELNELAESIKDKGVIQPIVIRPNTGGKPQWELVAGERRWRASKIAGAGSIPAIARNLDDRAVLEIQVIENLQRADVHPLDEANGYKELVDKHGYTADVIADKVGKSKEYVYGRMKLADLLPEIQVRFYEDKLTAGHAILLARLPEAGQIETVKNGLFEEMWDGSAYVKELVSVRTLASWIRRQLHLTLTSAPFPLEDASLIPAAGACVTCPKRTGTTPQLWPDVDGDTCTDRDCYNRKIDAFITRKVSYEDGIRLTATGKISSKKTGAKYFIGEGGGAVQVDSKKDRCEYTRPGVYIDGSSPGSMVDVCIAPICKKHHPDSYLNKDKDSAPKPERAKPSPNQEVENKSKIERQVREKLNIELLRAAIDQSSKISRLELDGIAASLHCASALSDEMSELILQRFADYKILRYGRPADILRSLRKMPDADLAKFIVAYVVGDSLDIANCSVADSILKARKIDGKAIEKRIRKEMSRQFEPTPDYDKMKCRGCGCTAKKPCKGGCWFAAFDVCASCESILEKHKPREIKVAPERVDYGGDIHDTICLTDMQTGKLKGFIEIEGQRYACTGAGSGGKTIPYCDLTPIYSIAQWQSGPTRSCKQIQLPSGRIPGYFGIRASWKGQEYVFGPETEEIKAVAMQTSAKTKPAKKKTSSKA